MPCLIAAISFFFPRVVLVALWLLSDYLGRAYETVLWPLLGFFMLPFTTLAYAWAINTNGSLQGMYLVVFIIALLVDLSKSGGEASSARRCRSGRC